MKVLLLSVNNEKDPYPVAPLGAAYIAKALIDQGHNCGVLDLCFVDNDYIAVEDSLKQFLPDIVGLSIRNIDNLTYNKSIFYMPRIKGIVENIKKLTSVPIIAGGSGFSIFPEATLRYLGLEFGIMGEGETAFVLLAEALNNGGPFYNIQNLCYLKDGSFYANKIDLSLFNYSPERSFLNNKGYFELGGMGNIQSKRGCPFKCSYCTYPHIDGNQLRLRDPESVVEELKESKAMHGIDYFFFVDDIFNFPEGHAAAICEGMIQSDLKVNWTCFATPKGMSGELAFLMKRAGCTGVEFGSDAGSENTLRGLGKAFSPDEIAYASECCNSIGLLNAHYIIIGGPEENISTLNETFSFFEKIKPTAVIALTGLRIYPNTRLYNMSFKNGIITSDSDLLEPVYYMTPEIEAVDILKTVSDYAAKNNNWIVPSLNIRCDANMLALLRKMGKKGPLWNML
ncbi:MAG: lipid biosynthesis B12-binding/radical SAM protein [Thermodesulfovibrionales bacterium]|nr:lipid biosynthesis B12-binding/radical SAM protein [Thermodesulfovibrionales bacterium]